MNRARLSAGPPEPHWLPGPLPQGPEGQAWARRGKDRRCWVFLLPPDGAGRTLDGMKSLFFPVPQRLSERDGAPRWSGPTPSCAAPTLVTDWGRAGACQQGRTSSARKRSFCRKFWHSLSLSRTVCLFTCARTVFACCPMLSCRGGGGRTWGSGRDAWWRGLSLASGTSETDTLRPQFPLFTSGPSLHPLCLPALGTRVSSPAPACTI